MTIKFAILGFLSWRPFSGYDLKKKVVDTSGFYWSGNNNQIYKTLIQMNAEGLVTFEVEQQENFPAKKVYSITEQGQKELKDWVLSSPELPELRNTFLIQLAWADPLSDPELEALLARYEEEISMQLLIQKEKIRRGLEGPRRSAREIHLWEMISDNIISTYETELNWIRRVRQGLNPVPEQVSDE